MHFQLFGKETIMPEGKDKAPTLLLIPGMNHGQLLIDHPEEIAKRI